MSEINWDKLVEQEPEFVEFCKALMWQNILDTDVNHDFLRGIYSIFQAGVSLEQAILFVRFNQRLGGENERR